MFNKSCGNRHSRHTSRRHSAFSRMSSSGNSAFDAYKTDTLRRLEDEQANFEDFLRRLRDSKDKAEFDQFMDDRAEKVDESDDREKESA